MAKKKPLLGRKIGNRRYFPTQRVHRKKERAKTVAKQLSKKKKGSKHNITAKAVPIQKNKKKMYKIYVSPDN